MLRNKLSRISISRIGVPWACLLLVTLNSCGGPVTPPEGGGEGGRGVTDPGIVDPEAEGMIAFQDNMDRMPDQPMEFVAALDPADGPDDALMGLETADGAHVYFVGEPDASQPGGFEFLGVRVFDSDGTFVMEQLTVELEDGSVRSRTTFAMGDWIVVDSGQIVVELAATSPPTRLTFLIGQDGELTPDPDNEVGTTLNLAYGQPKTLADFRGKTRAVRAVESLDCSKYIDWAINGIELGCTSFEMITERGARAILGGVCEGVDQAIGFVGLDEQVEAALKLSETIVCEAIKVTIKLALKVTKANWAGAACFTFEAAEETFQGVTGQSVGGAVCDKLGLTKYQLDVIGGEGDGLYSFADKVDIGAIEPEGFQFLKWTADPPVFGDSKLFTNSDPFSPVTKVVVVKQMAVQAHHVKLVAPSLVVLMKPNRRIAIRAEAQFHTGSGPPLLRYRWTGAGGVDIVLPDGVSTFVEVTGDPGVYPLVLELEDRIRKEVNLVFLEEFLHFTAEPAAKFQRLCLGESMDVQLSGTWGALNDELNLAPEEVEIVAKLITPRSDPHPVDPEGMIIPSRALTAPQDGLFGTWAWTLPGLITGEPRSDGVYKIDLVLRLRETRQLLNNTTVEIEIEDCDDCLRTESPAANDPDVCCQDDKPYIWPDGFCRPTEPDDGGESVDPEEPEDVDDTPPGDCAQLAAEYTAAAAASTDCSFDPCNLQTCCCQERLAWMDASIAMLEGGWSVGPEEAVCERDEWRCVNSNGRCQESLRDWQQARETLAQRCP